MIKVLTNKQAELIKKIIFFTLIIVIIGFGIYWRISRYNQNYYLYIDEILLSLNIIYNKVIDCFGVLIWGQKAPPLYLVAEKIITFGGGIGINAKTLRLLPLISGILSLFAFFALSLKVFKHKLPVIISLLVFSILPCLIYYSNEIKPYSSDVLVFLCLILLYNHIDISNLSYKKVITYCICSIGIILFSFPAFCIIPGIILAKFIEAKKILNLKKVLIILLSIICVGLYFYIINYNCPERIHSEFDNGLLNFTTTTLIFIISKFLIYINVQVIFIGFAFFIGGAILSVIEKNKYSICMLCVFIAACVLSLLRVYPMYGRAMLYLTPMFILFLVKPLDFSLSDIKNKSGYFIKNCLLLCTFYAIFPVVDFIKYIPDIDLMAPKEVRQAKKESILEFFNIYKSSMPIYTSDEGYVNLDYLNKEQNKGFILNRPIIGNIYVEPEKFYAELKEFINNNLKYDEIYILINKQHPNMYGQVFEYNDKIPQIEKIIQEFNLKYDKYEMSEYFAFKIYNK